MCDSIIKQSPRTNFYKRSQFTTIKRNHGKITFFGPFFYLFENIFSFLSPSCAPQNSDIKFNMTAFWQIFIFSSSQTGCVVLHLILHYFLLTNYAWMLCEGFYLHTVLVSAFISEQKLVKWLMVLGWTLPALFLILYGFLRGFVADEQDRNM